MGCHYIFTPENTAEDPARRRTLIENVYMWSILPGMLLVIVTSAIDSGSATGRSSFHTAAYLTGTYLLFTAAGVWLAMLPALRSTHRITNYVGESAQVMDSGTAALSALVAICTGAATAMWTAWRHIRKSKRPIDGWGLTITIMGMLGIVLILPTLWNALYPYFT